MKRLLLITLLLGFIYPCEAQQNGVRQQERLSPTVIYKTTTTFEREDYAYQCDVDDGSQLVTLYNKENKLTYEDIVYKATGEVFSCEFTESKVIVGDSEMKQKANAIVDGAFTKAMVDEIGKDELLITMLLSATTGEVIEVNFMFMTFELYARVPLHIYREIEVNLREQIHYTPGELGKQLNHIMLAWTQKPKGKLP